MGADKFDMSQPESYLFGDNYDLNYLGGVPQSFPYVAPLPNEPMQMLNALINVRKETLKLVNTSGGEGVDTKWTVEFVFDCDVPCSVTIYMLAKEEYNARSLKYVPQELYGGQASETYHFPAGMEQLFSQSSSVFNPNAYGSSELMYHVLDDKGEFNIGAPYPFVLHLVAKEGEGEDPKQSHVVVASIEKVYDQCFTLKPLKQKLHADGLLYLMQEIYGIENKVSNKSLDDEDDVDADGEYNGGSRKLCNDSSVEEGNDNSFECVICMSELRDTLILPCRHLCLCNNCANSLRYQANNCPICRVPFRALLQLKAVKRSQDPSGDHIPLGLMGSTQPLHHHQLPPPLRSHGLELIDIPPGYEPVALVEALNGLTTHSTVQPIPPQKMVTKSKLKNSKQSSSSSSTKLDENLVPGAPDLSLENVVDDHHSSTTTSTTNTTKSCDGASFHDAEDGGEDGVEANGEEEDESVRFKLNKSPRNSANNSQKATKVEYYHHKSLPSSPAQPLPQTSPSKPIEVAESEEPEVIVLPSESVNSYNYSTSSTSSFSSASTANGEQERTLLLAAKPEDKSELTEVAVTSTKTLTQDDEDEEDDEHAV